MRPNRFHPHPNGRLLVIYSQGREGNTENEVHIVEVQEDGSPGPRFEIELRKPLSRFFTATPRAGCQPSAYIDLLGEYEGTMRYARLDLKGQL